MPSWFRLVVQLNPPGERPLQGIGGSTVSLLEKGMRISSARALSPVCSGLRRDRWPVVLMSAPTTTGYTVYDREYYLAPDAIQFVRPGLNISIQSAQIGSDGRISTDFQFTDVPRPGRHPNRWT
jgi:hypothetical protein